jgi:hypothetical protein
VVIPMPEPVSRFTSTRWAFEGMLAATGATTDVAADACWALPEDLRNSMSLEEKQSNNCRCMGLNALDQNSCNFPGLGKYRDSAINDPEPIAPVKPGNPPADPVLPEKPVEPANQADNIAMSAYFDQLKVWENEVNAIQDQYKQDVTAYQSNVNIYQAQLIDYQEKLSTWQITRNAAVNKAEGTIDNLLTNYGWSFVDKSDLQVYWWWIIRSWMAQGLIITLAFIATLVLIKRKDQI